MSNKGPSKIDKQKLLELRDQEKLEFTQIAKIFNCSKQGVHNMYYREKVKELLPITAIEFFTEGWEEVFKTSKEIRKELREKRGKAYILETIEDVREELKDSSQTLTELVNKVIENRFIGGDDE